MFIESLECVNFRNYRELRIEFDPGINFLFGDNAQGKTNILEAVYLCSFSRSHKGSREKEMVRFGEEEAHIKAFINKKNVSHRIDFHIKSSGKRMVSIDGFPVRKISELFDFMNVIIFSADDLSIVKSGPAERRKYIDRELSKINFYYLKELYSYNKVLQNRNKLLKDIQSDEGLAATLDIWDEQLVRYGISIMKKRREFLREIEEIIIPLHEQITHGEEKIALIYEPNVREEEFYDKLKKAEEKDRILKTTSVGPHRDDFSIVSNGLDLRVFGSQGQQRSAALSLKLSEIRHIEKKTGERPILLLDDVFSELDVHRQKNLLSEIANTQTIMTGTGFDDKIREQIRIDKLFYVKEGTVTEK